MGLLQHFNLIIIYHAIIHVLFSKSQDNPGVMHVIVYNLLTNVCSNDAVVDLRLGVTVFREMAFHSFDVLVFEELSTCQSSAIEDYSLGKFVDALFIEFGCNEINPFCCQFADECIQKWLHVDFHGFEGSTDQISSIEVNCGLVISMFHLLGKTIRILLLNLFIIRDIIHIYVLNHASVWFFLSKGGILIEADGCNLLVCYIVVTSVMEGHPKARSDLTCYQLFVVLFSEYGESFCVDFYLSVWELFEKLVASKKANNATSNHSDWGFLIFIQDLRSQGYGNCSTSWCQ